MPICDTDIAITTSGFEADMVESAAVAFPPIAIVAVRPAVRPAVTLKKLNTRKMWGYIDRANRVATTSSLKLI